MIEIDNYFSFFDQIEKKYLFWEIDRMQSNESCLYWVKIATDYWRIAILSLAKAVSWQSGQT